MPVKEDAMRLEDIAVLLTAAAKLCNHRQFVVAGSLSVIGSVLEPPASMVTSLDVDFYPRNDPDRGFVEIASALSEHTPFSKEHGFYADPIHPRMLTLPEGWESRLVQVPLSSGVVAWFVDVVDAAAGKLTRGADNDLRWVRAALAARLFSSNLLRDRIKTVRALEGEVSGALGHLAALELERDAAEEPWGGAVRSARMTVGR